jgi:quercetin dioxygenase-like cupin family protein
MKTAHVSMTYAPVLTWEPFEVEGATGQAWMKTLARDRESGARTALVKYSAGYEQPEQTAKVFSDTIVLEGDFTRGGDSGGKGSYFYQPRDGTYGPLRSENGATMLVMTGGHDQKYASSEPIFVKDTEEGPWLNHKERAATEGRKRSTNEERWRVYQVLRLDEDAAVSIGLSRWQGETASLEEDHRHNEEQGQYLHTHSYIEEMFVVEGQLRLYEGDVDGHVLFNAGTLMYRPAGGVNEASVHGCLALTEAPYTMVVRYEQFTPAHYEDMWTFREQDSRQSLFKSVPIEF